MYCARRSSNIPYPTENDLNIAAFLAGPCTAFEHELHVYLQIARLPKHNGARGRTAVITQGALPTVVASEGKVASISRTQFLMLSLKLLLHGVNPANQLHVAIHKVHSSVQQPACMYITHCSK